MASCIEQPNGTICPPTSDGWSTCRPWDLESDAVNCYANEIVEESLQIGGTTVNVYKLLGIYDQLKSTDDLQTGKAIASSSVPGFSPSDAFTKTQTSWRSNPGQLITDSYIGYDFGVRLLANGRQRYGIDANVRYAIKSVGIKQSDNPNARVQTVRLERSDDGKKWYGVQVIQLPNTNELRYTSITNSVPARYWRLRPTKVDVSCGYWEVQSIVLSEHQIQPNNNEIQDLIWLENRAREYSKQAIKLKGVYTPQLSPMNLTSFGMSLEQFMKFQIGMSLSQCINLLGRPIVVGDILELPAEAMITHNLTRQQLFLEVISVGWDTSGSMTPGWKYTMLSVVASPATASEETQDIFGDKVQQFDESGLAKLFDGTATAYQDFGDVTEAIRATSNTQVPERGKDMSGTIRQISAEDVAHLPDNSALKKHALTALERNSSNRLFIEDGMPPNGEPYTEGPDLPEIAEAGAYHRLTYAGSAKDIPTKLYRFSLTKNRWVFIESDMRELYNDQTKLLSEFTGSQFSTPAREVFNNEQ